MDGQEQAGDGPAAGSATGEVAAAHVLTGVPRDGAPGNPSPESRSPEDGAVERRRESSPFGVPGLPVNRSHPFYVGFMGAIGVLVAYWLVTMLGRLTEVLTLMLVALFLALGLDPVVAWLQRRGLSRGWAVTTVVLGVIAVFAGFVAAVVPTLVSQGSAFGTQLPALLTEFENSSAVHWLDQHFGVISTATDQLKKVLTNQDTWLQLFGGVYGAGKAVVSGAFSAFTVLVLTLYILASKQSMTEAAYRLVPASRRERVRLLGDEIIRRIGAYIAGQVAVATINAVLTYLMLTILGLDYRLVLSIAVGLLGLIPMIGATLGACLVVLVALFDSWQLAAVALVYYVVYQQLENYVISPRIMARTVAVPGAVTVIAALVGGSLLGMVGALVAIPVAAGVLLILEEVMVPRQARQ
ncbi:MAG TPA: AI-2E family transporter [Kineosporiaceae bacterium]|nr:AI-2E family transporter [Kineosporiaceae bacterium]